MMNTARYYVYQLVDPRDGEPFYVGKGCGKRIRPPVQDARAGRIFNAEKHKRLAEIAAAGLTAREETLRSGLTEAEALEIERALIAEMRDQLTNISGGCCSNAERVRQQANHWSGRMKSFDAWVASATTRQRQAVTDSGKTLRQFYDEMVEFWRRMAALPI